MTMVLMSIIIAHDHKIYSQKYISRQFSGSESIELPLQKAPSLMIQTPCEITLHNYNIYSSRYGRW